MHGLDRRLRRGRAASAPDGKWIAYATNDSDTRDDADVFVIPAAGGDAGKPLVDGEQWESAPDWGP